MIDSPGGAYVEPDEDHSRLLRVNYNQITKQRRIIGGGWV